MTLTNILGWYLLIINFVAFYLYWEDKRRAKKDKWRIKESTLLLVGLLGGSFGSLVSMHVFRHKTQHWKFKILVPLFFVLHAVLFFYLNLK